MSYPSGWDLVNITGTYVGRNGVPCVGSVTLSSPQLVLRSGTIVPAADITFDLDSSGSFTGQIPATDDPNASPIGWTYTVTENVPGGRQGYQIVAPHASTGIDLSTVIPVTMPQPPTFGFPYVTLSQLAGTAYPATGASLIGFSQPETGAVGRTLQARGQDYINVKDFGAVGDGVTNCTTAFTNAMAAALATGGTLYVPAGTYMVSTLVVQSNTRIVGDGKMCTTLRLIAGTNSDLIQGYNAPSLFGSNSNGGVQNVEMRDLCLDGNSANNTAGSCISIYGWSFDFSDMWIINAPVYGMHCEGGPGAPSSGIGLEAAYTRLTIQLCGQHAVYYGGPHDSQFLNVIVLGASQSAANTYDGFHFYGSGTSRLIGCHSYDDDAINHRYAIFDGCGGLQIIGGDYEGGASANAYFDSNTNGITYVSSGTRFYSNTGTSNVIINVSMVFYGMLEAAYANGNTYGISLGDGTTGGANNCIIDVEVYGVNLGAIDFTHSGGYNRIRVRGYLPGGPGYVGTPKNTDLVDLQLGGVTGITSQLYTQLNTNSYSAAGTTQATATQLPCVAAISVSAGSSGSGVILPTSIPGISGMMVINLVNVAINVYPPVGAQINLLGTNIPFSLASGASAIFSCVTSSQWGGR